MEEPRLYPCAHVRDEHQVVFAILQLLHGSLNGPSPVCTLHPPHKDIGRFPQVLCDALSGRLLQTTVSGNDVQGDPLCRLQDGRLEVGQEVSHAIPPSHQREDNGHGRVWPKVVLLHAQHIGRERSQQVEPPVVLGQRGLGVREQQVQDVLPSYGAVARVPAHVLFQFQRAVHALRNHGDDPPHFRVQAREDGVGGAVPAHLVDGAGTHEGPCGDVEPLLAVVEVGHLALGLVV